MKTLFTILALIFSANLLAQKAHYDILSYTAPAGWEEKITGSYISYSKSQNKGWGQIAIYKSTKSKGDIESDIKNEWEAVVLSLRPVEKDEMTDPVKINGWSKVSRAGTWKYNGADVITILTVFSNNNTCVSILCNTTADTFMEEFLQMLQTIDLPPATENATQTNTPVSSNAGKGSAASIVGLWGSYINESSGMVNGMQMFTGGYFRREYIFYKDGTYLYKAKDWSTLMKEILFVYETGNYKINGSQLTLTPTGGKGEWWSKAASGRTVGWGSRVRSSSPKREKISYSFEVRYLSGMNRSYLYLRHSKPTERDGARSSQKNIEQEYSYGKRDKPETSLIDTPPGIKTGFENK